MNRHLIFIVAGVLSCSSLAYAADSAENLANNKYGIAKIDVSFTNKNKQPDTRRGTGFFFYKSDTIKQSYLLTALHVVDIADDEELNSITVSFLTSRNNTIGHCDDVEVAQRDREQDLALLGASCLPDRILQLGNAMTINPGTALDVLTWGPAGMQPNVYAVKTVGRNKGKNTTSLSNITKSVSGAPAVDKQGKVVGIVLEGNITNFQANVVAIGQANNLRNAAMQSEERAKFEKLESTVQQHEALMEQLKYNILVTAEWMVTANPVTGGPKLFNLNIRFEKAFHEQYLPISVYAIVVPRWQITKKNVEKDKFPSSEGMKERDRPSHDKTIPITEEAKTLIESAKPVYFYEIHGWLSNELQQRKVLDDDPLSLEILGADGTITLTMPPCDEQKKCKQLPPKPFHIGPPR